MQLMKFHAQWCGPCKMMKPVIDAVIQETGIELREIDVSELSKETDHWKVRSVPTFILLNDDHEELWRHIGTIKTADILEVIEKYRN